MKLSTVVNARFATSIRHLKIPAGSQWESSALELYLESIPPGKNGTFGAIPDYIVMIKYHLDIEMKTAISITNQTR